MLEWLFNMFNCTSNCSCDEKQSTPVNLIIERHYPAIERMFNSHNQIIKDSIEGYTIEQKENHNRWLIKQIYIYKNIKLIYEKSGSNYSSSSFHRITTIDNDNLVTLYNEAYNIHKEALDNMIIEAIEAFEISATNIKRVSKINSNIKLMEICEKFNDIS